ncbi:MAG: SDR family oxidoreductase [Bacteroidota bacterium]
MRQNLCAFITGASGGIGYEFARLIAADQIDLVLVARNQDKLKRIKQELESTHQIRVDILPKDLSQPNAAREVYEVVKNMDIEMLINNAGFGEFGEFIHTPWLKESQMIQLNITTLTQFTKLFLPQMVKRKSGFIMNVASTAAFQPGPLMAVYYATKAYVLSFTEAIAEEVRDCGVKITALCPGPTESGFQSTAHMEESKLVKNRKMPSAQEVATYGYEALKKGKVVAVHGLQNKILANSVKFFPRNMVSSMVKKMQEKES